MPRNTKTTGRMPVLLEVYRDNRLTASLFKSRVCRVDLADGLRYMDGKLKGHRHAWSTG